VLFVLSAELIFVIIVRSKIKSIFCLNLRHFKNRSKLLITIKFGNFDELKVHIVYKIDSFACFGFILAF